MSEAVIIALLALVGNIAVSWFANQKSTALIIYRVDQLEVKVNKHNNVIERTYELEKHDATVQQDLKSIHETLERLEDYHRG